MVITYLVEHRYDFSDADETAMFRAGAEVMLSSVHPVGVSDYSHQTCGQCITLPSIVLVLYSQ